MRFANLSEPLQGTTGHYGAKAKGCRDIVFMCVMFHNMLRTHQGGADRALTPGNDVAKLQESFVGDQTTEKEKKNY